MAIQLLDPETQVNTLDAFDDTKTIDLATLETNPANMQEFLEGVISKLSSLTDVQVGDWYTGPNTPSALETGSQRGVNDLNTALHDVEKKRVLRNVHNLTNVTVGGSDNFVILGTGELPSNTTAAVGGTTTLGTMVAAHGGTFGTHSLSEDAGNSAVNPLNLCAIVDGATRDPILSGGAQIWGLLQGESGVTDGATITDTTTTRVQISFVILNGTGDDLIACPAVDIQGKTINYCTREQVRLEDLNRQDFLSGAVFDVGAGAGTIDRQTAYTNQGATVVTTAANATLDLGAGLTWEIGDNASAAAFQVIEGSGGGTTQFNILAAVDEYDNDAVVVDFASGMLVNSGGTAIDIAQAAAGTIQRAADLTLAATGSGELILNDSNMISEATWAGPGVKVSETTAEVAAYETAFGGEVSLMNALVQAKNTSARRVVYSVATANVAADVDVSGPANDNNLDTDLGDLSAGTFTSDYEIVLNGQDMRPGANAAANFDVYPGTSLANGQLKFERKLKSGDTVKIVDWAV